MEPTTAMAISGIATLVLSFFSVICFVFMGARMGSNMNRSFNSSFEKDDFPGGMFKSLFMGFGCYALLAGLGGVCAMAFVGSLVWFLVTKLA